MLTLNDGRSELWQWDTGRTLAVDADCSQLHFSNKAFGRSIDVDVVDGTAIIPDVLLQTDKDLNVWAFVGTAENGYTKISKTYKVNRRNKPADYVFTPVEQTTIAEIAAIAQSVRDDADAGLFDGKPGEDGRDGIDGKDGAPGKDGISATHSWNGTVLTITSASGTSSADLKGDKGEQGIPGTAGHTPEYGVDYGTPEQIAGIAKQAADILQPDVNQLKDDLDDLDSKIFGFKIVGISSIEYTKGGFVNENGTITDNDNFMYSDFIEVREGQEIEYSINAYNAQVITISAWKYDKTFVLNKSVYGKVSSPNVLSGVYTVPSDIRYIRITRWKAYNYGDNDSADIPLKYSIVSEANEAVNEVKEYAYGLTKTVVSANLYNENDTGVKTGYYLDTDGTEKSASTCRITGFIKVKPNTKYSKNAFNSISLGHIGSAYDKDKKWISNINGVRHESVDDFTTPFNIEYVRLNVSSSNGTTMVTEGDYTQFPTEYIGYENYTTAREDILLNENQLAQAHASNWKGKVWHGFGTSITNTSNEGKYANYLAEISGMTFVNHGYSGGCIGSGSGVANSQIINMIDSANLSNADLVTVEGFVNDWSQSVPIGDNTDKTTETLKGAIYVAITKLLSKTNATIIFLTDHTGRLFNSTDIRRTVLRNGKTQDDYRKATIEMCNYLNIPVIDVGRKCMISEDTPNYLVDQIHHTEKGGEQFARTVWSELKNIIPRIV